MIPFLPKLKSACLLAAIVFSLTNCKNDRPAKQSKNDTACGIANPIENLPWLHAQFNAFIGGPEMNAIVLYEYNGNQVIEVQNGLSSSTNQHQYLCSGQKLDFNEGSTFADFTSKRKEIKVLYGTKIW